jgi:acetyl-CoA acyltransferase
VDAFAAESHHRAAAAWADGRFAAEVTPVKAPAADGSLTQVTADQSVRPATSPEILASLKPAFRAEAWEQRFPQIQWRVTAGNSSPVNDGAAAILITSSETARRLGLRPRARLHAFAVTGDDPLYMLTGIIPATRKVLDRAGLTLADIGAFEVNEAFASVVLAWLAETGARLMTTLLSVLEQTGQRYGLQTMCEAGGLANATIIERL